jgi:CRISPR-associated protein Csx10
MRYSVTLELKSPVLVGGRRDPSAYFLPSRDYIPGGVLRAALALAITEGCPYYTESEKYHWVQFAAMPECMSCSWRGICDLFGRMQISHLYKDGARVAPLTAYRCKYNPGHPTFDTLLARGRLRCPECIYRVERFSGYLNGEYRDVTVKQRLIMRLSVDPYRGVAQDHQLYTLRVLDTGQTFKGWLDIPGAGVIPENLELRLGAKTTAGLGRAAVLFELADEPGWNTVEQRIERFQKVLRESVGAGKQYTYFTLTLLSDALPDMEPTLAEAELAPTLALRKKLMKAVFPPPLLQDDLGVEVIKAVVDYKVNGGYCTAERNNGRQKAALYVAAGSVFLCRVHGALNDAVLQELLRLEKHGVGLKTEDGYGALRVCDEFHLNTGGVSDEVK